VAKYLSRRLIDLVIALWGVSTVVFVVLRLSGDPVALFATETASQEDIDRLRAQLGFNDPIWVQYARFLAGVVQGDFGSSLRYFRPALPLVLQTLPATLQLTAVALAIATLVALPLGTVAAIRKNTWYWPEKIASNRRRDRDTDAELLRHGWEPVRVWEHEDPSHAAQLILVTVKERRH
jgi:peptide/nickel transport system permease protein